MDKRKGGILDEKSTDLAKVDNRYRLCMLGDLSRLVWNRVKEDINGGIKFYRKLKMKI